MAFKMLKIFHTADVHLGLKFSSYPESVSKQLSEARFETFDTLVKTANEQHCHLFVVAGDLFDHLRVPQRDILRAAKILGQFSGVVAVLPGNHDYVTSQEDDLWKIFQSARQDRLLVLTERRPYSLHDFDLDACIYAAPCQNKHSKTHAVGWITDSPRQNACFQIGLAHGSFEGLTPDTEGDYYPMKKISHAQSSTSGSWVISISNFLLEQENLIGSSTQPLPNQTDLIAVMKEKPGSLNSQKTPQKLAQTRAVLPENKFAPNPSPPESTAFIMNH